MELRKHDTYRVRLDRSMSGVPLRAQKLALDRLRKGEAGSLANLFVQLFYDSSSTILDEAREIPGHFEQSNLEEQIECAMKEAMARTTFEPNESQRDAVLWALKRKLGVIRGPPGTGKTRSTALLISTALQMKLKQRIEDDVEDDVDAIEKDDTPRIIRKPRILAVTHSNGAADVLLQALLDMNVPAVRAGRPASVSPSVQHRTIAALAERMPEVVALRQQAADASLDKHTRQSAANDAKRYMHDGHSMIATSAEVVVSSCIGAKELLSSIGENENKGEPTFPIVILDEAAQTTEPALVCALGSAKAGQVILVGDTKQLPPTVTSQDADLRKQIGCSPMERLLQNGIEEFSLKEQYRMPQSLLAHPNKYFYNSVVKCAAIGGANENLPPPRGFPWPSPHDEPLAFLKVGHDSEEAHSFGGRSNPTEVKVIMDIIENFIEAGDINAKDIAIISPYSKQVQLFQTELSNASLKSGCQTMTNVKVGTVDSFQGQETDLVVFSAVRSNLFQDLGFIQDPRRLNVAITRARRGLIVVGDQTVLRSCRHWAALLNHCTDRGCIITETEYNSKSSQVEVRLAAESPDDEKKIRSDFELDLDDELYGLF